MPKLTREQKIAWYKNQMYSMGFELRDHEGRGVMGWYHVRSRQPLPTYYDIEGNDFCECFVNAGRRYIRSL